MVRSWSFGALLVIIGIGIGWTLRGPGSSDSSEPLAAPRMAQLTPPPLQPAVQPGLDLAQLHAAIRDELANALKLPVTHQQSAAVAKSAPASPEVEAQRRETVQEIREMIAAGEWGETERSTFLSKLTLLDQEQKRQLLHELMVGLNNGTIHSTLDMPL